MCIYVYPVFGFRLLKVLKMWITRKNCGKLVNKMWKTLKILWKTLIKLWKSYKFMWKTMLKTLNFKFSTKKFSTSYQHFIHIVFNTIFGSYSVKF